jgi:hypothetical protein
MNRLVIADLTISCHHGQSKSIDHPYINMQTPIILY